MKLNRILACLAVLLLTIACGCGNKVIYVGKETDNSEYLNIKVVELDGKVTLTRNAEKKAVYKQMLIKDGDNIVTEENDTAKLSLGSDNYLQINGNSDIKFKLEDTSSKRTIHIQLNNGSINSKIENNLSDADRYEVYTSDAVMTVIKAEFEVAVSLQESSRETSVFTKSGSVKITLLNKNSEQKIIESGDTAVIEIKTDSNSVGQPAFKEEKADNVSSESTTSSEKQTPVKASENEKIEKAKTCVKCKNELKKGETHLLTCGKGHYSCDGKNHGICKDCKKRMCSSNHKLLKCGVHYSCSSDANKGHYALGCGHYVCSSSDSQSIHKVCVVCKAYACKSDQKHSYSACGCVYCGDVLGEEHIKCEACGLCKSDGEMHGLCEYCSGCKGDGLTHSLCQICGECKSDGQSHGEGICN